MLELISPQTHHVSLSENVPPELESRKIAHAKPYFGSTSKCRYLIQKLHLQPFQAWFIDMLSVDEHKIELLEDETPSFFILVQIENTLDCKINDLQRSQLQEWSINLYYSKTIFAELHLRALTTHSAFLYPIPDEEGKSIAEDFPNIKEFYESKQGKERSDKLHEKNGICSLEIMDFINSFRVSVQGIETYTQFTKSCFKLLSEEKLPMQNLVEDKDLQKVYSLKRFVLEHITEKLTVEDLHPKFNLSYDDFKKICRVIYNMTPSLLLKYYRMSAIRIDLQNGIDLKPLAVKYNYDYNSLLRAYQNFYGEHANPHHLKIKG